MWTNLDLFNFVTARVRSRTVIFSVCLSVSPGGEWRGVPRPGPGHGTPTPSSHFQPGPGQGTPNQDQDCVPPPQQGPGQCTSPFGQDQDRVPPAPTPTPSLKRTRTGYHPTPAPSPHPARTRTRYPPAHPIPTPWQDAVGGTPVPVTQEDFLVLKSLQTRPNKILFVPAKVYPN